MKVFVVDHSTPVRKRIIDILSELEGVEIVGEAEDAIAAAVLIRESQPEVVILDVQMPAFTGIDLLNSLKSNDHVPVTIALTNYPYPQYRKKCQEAGAQFVFDKSSEFEKITEVFREMIGGMKVKPH